MCPLTGSRYKVRLRRCISQEKIRADGQKIGQFSCAEINEKRQAYFEANMEELITQALVDVWRLPMFARYRQTQSQSQSVSQRATIE